MSKRYPFSGIPSGWYVVATSDELKPGAVLTRHYFGRELVLYRTEGGEARVTDAYCPHLGAHLGQGSVAGENIRCPFHSFEFDGGGRCVRTGYDKTPPRKAVLGTWTVREHDGYVLAWHDAEGRAPSWTVPVLEGTGEAWTPFRTRALRLNTHPQETSENSVDSGHFLEVHAFSEAWSRKEIEIEGHVLKTFYGLKRQVVGKLALPAHFDVEVHGLGYSLIHIEVPGVGIKIRSLVLSTPIDEEHVEMRLGISVRRWGGPLSYLIREASSLELLYEVSQDAPIWERKRYVERPALAEGDGPIAAYRRYCQQFYPNAEAGSVQRADAA